MTDILHQAAARSARLRLTLPSVTRRYAYAIAMVAMAWFARWLLTPYLGLRFPFITFFLAVFVAAWYGGLGPTVLATGLSAAAAGYFFFPPVHSFGLTDPTAIAGLLLFMLPCIATGWLAETRHRAQRETVEAARIADAERIRAEEQAIVAEEEAARAEEERLRAEDEARRADIARTEALAAQATLEWQAGLLEQTHDAVLVWELGGPLVFWNRAAETLYGWARNEVVGKRRTNKLLPTAPTNGSSMQAVEEQVASVGNWDGELRQRARDGSELIVESRLVLLASTGGRRLVLETSRDITARRLTEEQLRQSQKMEAVGQLAGGLAHDFNNLFGAIIGYTSLLLPTFEADDPRQQELTEVQEAAERAAQLTQQLLAFSRRQVLQPKLLDLNVVLADLLRLAGRLLGEHIELALVPQAGLWAISADRGQIEQVLMNLVVNARDAMPEGGMLTLETRNVELDEKYVASHLHAAPGPHVMLTVTDTGIGMDEETQRHIFEPFFTTKAAGEGTGLGLAMVYGVVQQSGGNIWVYSEPGQGTTFKLFFPRSGEGHVPEATARPDIEVHRGTETVLLVEDNDSLRTVTTRILKAHGYAVLEAANGGEAILLAEQHEGTIHLVLTDVVLPRVSGRKVAERLRMLRPDVRVLYMSGYADDAVVRHGALEPDMAFIQKPFRPDTLTRRVREVLEL